MNNSMDKNAMFKSGLKSVLALRRLARITKFNQLNSLISILNDADLKVTTCSTLKKNQSGKN